MLLAIRGGILPEEGGKFVKGIWALNYTETSVMKLVAT